MFKNKTIIRRQFAKNMLICIPILVVDVFRKYCFM